MGRFKFSGIKRSLDKVELELNDLSQNNTSVQKTESVNEHSGDDHEILEPQSVNNEVKESIRNLIAFWILGLCTNYSYNIMLSAAHDILSVDSDNNSTLNETLLLPRQNQFDCNPLSTGVILLADIIPGLLIKAAAPFFHDRISFGIRIAVCIMFNSASLLIVGLSKPVWINLIGVACASISSSFGEATFLGLTAFYDKNVVSTFASGTGGAGLFGSLSYAGLTGIGITPKHTVLVMLIVPVIQTISYWGLLTNHPNNIRTTKEDVQPLMHGKITPTFTFIERINIIKKLLLKYMLPLLLVYFAEYFINQGLFELVYFENIWLTHSEQYRWYQMEYQLGVFISRSSVNFVQIKYIWVLSILQFANVALMLLQIFFKFLPSIWMIFGLVFYEGLLGGAAYVNTFFRISKEVKPEHREFSMGVTSVADTTGIALSAFISYFSPMQLSQPSARKPASVTS